MFRMLCDFNQMLVQLVHNAELTLRQGKIGHHTGVGENQTFLAGTLDRPDQGSAAIDEDPFTAPALVSALQETRSKRQSPRSEQIRVR